MAKQQKPPMDEQPEGQSSFGRAIGNDLGPSSTPVEGELANGARPGGLDVEQDNAISDQENLGGKTRTREPAQTNKTLPFSEGRVWEFGG